MGKRLRVVISGVNLVEAGPLKVFLDAIKSFSSHENVDVICLVNNKELFRTINKKNVDFIEYKAIKKSWFLRIYFEYVYCFFLSKKLNPDIWFSMHDMSTRLPKHITQFVYCHNPTVFYKPNFIDFRYSIKTFIFSLLYKYLYKINIRSNENVICQQEWFSKEFAREFRLNNLITSRPVNDTFDDCKEKEKEKEKEKDKDKIIIFYPAMPRTFKNHELIFKAIELLNNKNQIDMNKFNFIFTFNTNDSPLTRYFEKKYSHLKCIDFVGHCDRKKVENYYKKSDYVIFPSKLETWGLPIQEAKEYKKPIILADLPYAHETLGDYDKVVFIDPNNPGDLSNTLHEVYLNKLRLNVHKFNISSRVLGSWSELTQYVIDKVV